MEGVILGMPDSWADSNYEAANIYTTKIGGVPDWPFPIGKEEKTLLRCNTCGINLCLLAQIHAPLSSESMEINKRIIYVFGCLVPHCETSLWRAIRVQNTTTNEINHVPTSSVAVSSNNINLQEDLCSFDFRDGPGHEDGDDEMDMEKLAWAFSEATNFTTTDRRRNNDVRSGREILSRGQLTVPVDDKIPVMPCFYIYLQAEKLSKSVNNEKSKASLLSFQECDYTSGDQSNGETYEEESYEYDRALNADRTYLKFKKRVDANPQQCFRYSHSGKSLLASEEVEKPKLCELCGGPRHYELQLMPALIYFLHEAADNRQRASLEKVDWMTLLIYTCSKVIVIKLNWAVKAG